MPFFIKKATKIEITRILIPKRIGVSYIALVALVLFIGALIYILQSGETARIKGYAVHGIDVSRYQGRIQWDTIKKQDIAFAFVKATEGINHFDTLFDYNWEALRKANIKRGAYHFFIPTLSPIRQAENFIRLVDTKYGDLPPVLDIESSGDISEAELIQNIKSWLYIVEMKYSIKPIIYTHYKFYNKYIAGRFDEYPIWIAKYGTSIAPRLESGKDWQFWQYGSMGRLRGIKGYVDFNVFNGSHEDLEAICINSDHLLSVD